MKHKLDTLLGAATVAFVIAVICIFPMCVGKSFESELQEANVVMVLNEFEDHGVVVEVLKNDGGPRIAIADKVSLPAGPNPSVQSGRRILLLWDGKTPSESYRQMPFRSDGRLASNWFTIEEIRELVSREATRSRR